MATRNLYGSLYKTVHTLSGILNTVATSLNETRTDHLGSGTSYKVWADEMTTDHASFKTLTDELVDDHATFKTAVDETETLIEEMYDDEEAKRDYLHFMNEADGVIGGDFTIAAAAATTLTGAGHVEFRMNGETFYCDLDTTITLEDSGDIVTGKWGAWRILIDREGTVTTQDTGSQMAFDNEEDALLNLSAVAPTANTVTIGYFTIDSDAGFNIGTDNVNGETAENVYHVRGPAKQVSGLHTALGASVAVGSTDTNFSHGTIDAKSNGVYLSQIGAGADVAFDDADTIGSGNFGGHLLVVGLDGASVYALAADGAAGSVSAMTYADAAAVNTAIDTLTDQLPEMFVPFGRIVVENGKGALFTYGTDDIAGTDGTATYTDATVGTWDRTVTTGFDSHTINPPAIPAELSASKPASAPATLSASKVASLSASVPDAHGAAAIDDTTWPSGAAS